MNFKENEKKKMSVKLLIFFNFLFFSQIVSVFSSEYIPVLIWTYNGVEKTKTPALQYVSGDEFAEYLTKHFRDKTLLFFSEENLSSEDFGWRDTNGQSSFESLKNIFLNGGNLIYFPMVHSPLHFVQNLAPDSKKLYVDVSEAENINNLNLYNQTYIFVSLGDAKNDENRPNLLKRHDNIVAKIIQNILKENNDIVFIYTAKHSSWYSGEDVSYRPRRHLMAQEENQFLNGSDEVYIYTETPPILKIKNEISLKDVELTDVNETNHKMIFSVMYPNDIILNFHFTGHKEYYWYLNQVEVIFEENSYILEAEGIEAPIYHSYHCSQKVVFKGPKGVSLTFSDIQVQPFLSTNKFGNAYECYDYMTAPIWSGLFVTMIFILIMTLGIGMILDIKTMDRFDDPKGKSIPINVAE